MRGCDRISFDSHQLPTWRWLFCETAPLRSLALTHSTRVLLAGAAVLGRVLAHGAGRPRGAQRGGMPPCRLLRCSSLLVGAGCRRLSASCDRRDVEMRASFVPPFRSRCGYPCAVFCGAQVRRATQRLHDVVIPTFARWLTGRCPVCRPTVIGRLPLFMLPLFEPRV